MHMLNIYFYVLTEELITMLAKGPPSLAFSHITVGYKSLFPVAEELSSGWAAFYTSGLASMGCVKMSQIWLLGWLIILTGLQSTQQTGERGFVKFCNYFYVYLCNNIVILGFDNDIVIKYHYLFIFHCALLNIINITRTINQEIVSHDLSL